MTHHFLPNTDISVSSLCLGTMTFGEQNTQEEAFAQLNYAVSEGINFIDTAEMYPIAAKPETQGLTEVFIGNWLKEQKNRDQLVLATKITGPHRGLDHIRNPLSFSPKNMVEALEGSLKRLQTDYIDLYQFHWPERVMNMFGKRGLQTIDNAWQDNIEQVLETSQTLIKQGKIRQIGISNESPWGLLRFLELHKTKQLPKTITIQNPYSLLNRLYEVGLAEIGMREQIGLLAYSPLGFGMLSGKHSNGLVKNSRLDLFKQFNRYTNKNGIEATKAYQDIAQKHGLLLSQMAIAFVMQQEFVSSTIIGATNLTQLKENIEAQKIVLSKDVINAIEAVHQVIPNPCP